MAVKLLAPYNGLPTGTIMDNGDKNTENALVSRLLATFVTTGGVPFAPNSPFSGGGLAPLYSPSTPTTGALGQIWVNTAGVPPFIYQCTGTNPLTFSPLYTSLAPQRALDVIALNQLPLIAAPTYAAAIAAAVAVAAGKIVAHSNGQLLICAVGGTPAAQPAFNASAPMVDGALIWFALGRANNIQTGADVPTITSSTTITGLVARPFWTNGGNGVSTPIFQNLSCPFFINGSGGNSTQSWCYQNGGNTNNAGMGVGISGLMSKIEFVTDAPKFAIGIWNSLGAQIFVYVNDAQVETDPTPYVTGNPAYYIVDYTAGTGRRMRTVRIECSGNANLTGIAVDTQSIVIPPANSAARLRGIWQSDSYGSTVSTYTVSPQQYIAELTMKGLGIAYTRNLSIGGIGYVNPAQNSGFTGPQLLSNNLFAGWNPNLIVIGYGHNDNSNPTATVAAGALGNWQLMRATYPNAFITILGPFSGNAGPGASYIALDVALQAQFTTWNDGNSCYIPMCLASSTSPWVSGTGTISALTGTGNSDFYTGADLVHPGYAGVTYLANRCIAAINQQLIARGL